jgi:hypothetical protein
VKERTAVFWVYQRQVRSPTPKIDHQSAIFKLESQISV